MKSVLLNKFLPSLILILGATAVAVAQGSGGPAPGTTPDPTAVPIDGGVSLLLAGGVAYGLKHLRNRRRKA
ncbi:PID-CTERM protein-sorting domain-containing protein [Hymenobacter humi]|uniref:PID-CTERM protein-sorting domain-containing protein n=1 Tax=Hymenobacter humi TaxID=1411620 RepID=A0ABW2TY91_9BACT